LVALQQRNEGIETSLRSQIEESNLNAQRNAKEIAELQARADSLAIEISQLENSLYKYGILAALAGTIQMVFGGYFLERLGRKRA
jgi:hypothetical protein